MNKQYSDSVLKSMNKDELISHIRMLEHNIEALNESCINQRNLLERIVQKYAVSGMNCIKMMEEQK